MYVRPATSFAIDVPAPPQITAPAARATVTVTTPLQWTAPKAAVSVLHFERIDRNGFILGTLDVATASTSTTFPDLTSLRATVVPGAAPFDASLHMETWGGVTGTNGLADATTGFGALLAGTVDFSHGISDSIPVTISR